jgi:hypothetical protein
MFLIICLSQNTLKMSQSKHEISLVVNKSLNKLYPEIQFQKTDFLVAKVIVFF